VLKVIWQKPHRHPSRRRMDSSAACTIHPHRNIA